MAAICEHWGIEHGCCYRCGQPARCEKAHLIDRFYDGLDDVQNLVPLCYPCHSEQPPFIPGEERRALIWAQTPDRWIYLDRIAALVRVQHPKAWLLANLDLIDLEELPRLLRDHCDLTIDDAVISPGTRMAHLSRRFAPV